MEARPVREDAAVGHPTRPVECIQTIIRIGRVADYFVEPFFELA